MKPINEYATETSRLVGSNSADRAASNAPKTLTESFIITPNPTENTFSVLLKSAMGHSGTINVYNTKGQVMFSEQLENLDGIKEINCQAWNSGLYIVELKSDKDTFIQKVVVRH